MKKYGKETTIKVYAIDAKLKNKQQVLNDIGRYGVQQLKKEAPKQTMAYVQGFKYKIVNDIVYIANTGLRSTLAHILEFGTVKMKAKPHFRPAFKKIQKYAEKKTREFKIKWSVK